MKFYLAPPKCMLPLKCLPKFRDLAPPLEISPDFCCFYGGGTRHDEDIMHSFQNFIVRLIPNHPPPPPLETRIWKLVVRALILTAGKPILLFKQDRGLQLCVGSLEFQLWQSKVICCRSLLVLFSMQIVFSSKNVGWL